MPKSGQYLLPPAGQKRKLQETDKCVREFDQVLPSKAFIQRGRWGGGGGSSGGGGSGSGNYSELCFCKYCTPWLQSQSLLNSRGKMRAR